MFGVSPDTSALYKHQRWTSDPLPQMPVSVLTPSSLKRSFRLGSPHTTLFFIYFHLQVACVCVSEALHLRVCRCACLDHAQTLMYMVSASLSTLCVSQILGSFCPCVQCGVCDRNAASVKFLLLATRHQYVQHKQWTESSLCTSHNRCHRSPLSHQAPTLTLSCNCFRLLRQEHWTVFSLKLLLNICKFDRVRNSDWMSYFSSSKQHERC